MWVLNRVIEITRFILLRKYEMRNMWQALVLHQNMNRPLAAPDQYTLGPKTLEEAIKLGLAKRLSECVFIW